VVGDAQRLIEVLPLENGRFHVTVDGVGRSIDSRFTGPVSLSLLIDGAVAEVNVLARGSDQAVEIGGRTHRFKLLDERALRARGRDGGGSGDRELRASMPGKVVAVLVDVGAEVIPGQGILVIEAMKMENEIGATRPGAVKEIRVRPGQAVEAGELLAVIE
jgi:biotin carboxyl carrier protein